MKSLSLRMSAEGADTALLLALAKDEGGGINFRGGSSIGKTTILDFAARAHQAEVRASVARVASDRVAVHDDGAALAEQKKMQASAAKIASQVNVRALRTP
jgi:hypothetical protein